MLTLSLVFEDRERGELKDYQRFDLSTESAMHLCTSMCGDDEWFSTMIDDEQTDVELRCALLKFITTYVPDALCNPAEPEAPWLHNEQHYFWTPTA